MKKYRSYPVLVEKMKVFVEETGFKSNTKEYKMYYRRLLYQLNKEEELKKSNEWNHTHREERKKNDTKRYYDNIEFHRKRCLTYYHNNREERDAYNKQWRLDNAELVKETTKQWRLDNAELVKEYTKQWRLDNADDIKKSWKKYYLTHREERKENRKKNKDHSNKVRNINREKKRKEFVEMIKEKLGNKPLFDIRMIDKSKVFYCGGGKLYRPYVTYGRGDEWDEASKDGYYIEIIRFNLSNVECNDLEMYYIDYFGLDNLVNKVKGGGIVNDGTNDYCIYLHIKK